MQAEAPPKVPFYGTYTVFLRDGTSIKGRIVEKTTGYSVTLKYGILDIPTAHVLETRRIERVIKLKSGATLRGDFSEDGENYRIEITAGMITVGKADVESIDGVPVQQDAGATPDAKAQKAKFVLSSDKIPIGRQLVTFADGSAVLGTIKAADGKFAVTTAYGTLKVSASDVTSCLEASTP